MKKHVKSLLSFFILNLTYLSAASTLTPLTAPLIQIHVQYKWFDSVENRSKGAAPIPFTSRKATATNQFQRLSIPLFFDTSKSVSEMLEHIKAVLGVPKDNLKIRLGIARKDRVIDIPFTTIQKLKMIKVRYAPPKDEGE